MTNGEKPNGGPTGSPPEPDATKRSNEVLKDAITALGDTNKGLQQANTDLQDTITALGDTNKGLQQANTDLQGTNNALGETNKELQQANTDLQGTNNALGATNDNLKVSIEAMKSAVKDVEGLVSKLRSIECRRFVPGVVVSCIGGALILIVLIMRWCNVKDMVGADYYVPLTIGALLTIAGLLVLVNRDGNE